MSAGVAYADEKGDYTRENRMPRLSLHANRREYIVDVLIVVLVPLIILGMAWIAAAEFGVPCGPCQALGHTSKSYSDSVVVVLFCAWSIWMGVWFLGRALWRLDIVYEPFF